MHTPIVQARANNEDTHCAIQEIYLLAREL